MATNHTIQTVPIPAANNIMMKQESQEVDISHLSEDDLRTLQKEDPFMYHSIPAVHKAKLSLKDVEQSKARPISSSIVSRKTRLSTECHVSLILDDLFLDDEEFMQGMDDCEGFDAFDDLLESLTSLSLAKEQRPQ